MENKYQDTSQKKLVSKGKRTAWIVTLVVFVAGVSLAFAQNKVAPIIPEVMNVFDISMASAGWLSSVFSVVALFTSLPAAFILARLGPRKCGIIALVCAVIGCFIGIFAGSIEVLMVSRIIEGIGVGIISVVAPALISMWFPAQKRGLPMGVWGAWQMAAQSLTFFVGDRLTMMFGWQGLWYLSMVILAISLVLYILQVKSPPASYNHADIENRSYSMREGLKVPSVWFVGLSTMCFTFACFGFANWIASYWVDTFGWTVAEANGYVSFIYFIEIFLAILVGLCLNYVKNRKRIAQIAYLLYAVILFFCFRMEDPSLIILFCVVYALVEGAIPTAFWTLIAQTVPKPELAGISIGVLGMLQNLGMLLGPPITGFTIEHFGWNLGSMPMVAASILGLILFCFAKIYPVPVPARNDHEAEQDDRANVFTLKEDHDG